MTRLPILRRCAAITPLLATLALCFSGCGLTTPHNDPSRFYVLAPVVSTPDDAVPDGPAIAIGRIEFPAYTDRPQIVTRVGANELRFSEFNRWAESLSASFSRALEQNLSALLNTDRVTGHPWTRSFPKDYEVYVFVLAFDAYPEQKSVNLTVRWRITTPQQAEVISESVVTVNEPVADDGYGGFVAAWNRAIGVLSSEVADAIHAAEQ